MEFCKTSEKNSLRLGTKITIQIPVHGGFPLSPKIYFEPPYIIAPWLICQVLFAPDWPKKEFDHLQRKANIQHPLL